MNTGYAWWKQATHSKHKLLLFLLFWHGDLPKNTGSEVRDPNHWSNHSMEISYAFRENPIVLSENSFEILLL